MARRTVKRVRDVVERRLGIRFQQTGIRGADLAVDLRKAGIPIRSVFDVGAHHGESVEAFRRWFPQATIHSFEPDPTSFALLSAKTSSLRFEAHDVALGAHVGPADFYRFDKSLMNSLVPNSSARSVTTVEVDTVDNMMERLHVADLSLLKIDTEGADLDVLTGAAQVLAQRRIAVIQVEASMSSKNDKHVPLAEFTNRLEPVGYFLFGLYEQAPEFDPPAPELRRANPVYIRAGVGTRLI